MGYVIFENSLRIRIECWRVEERLFVRKGTETGVEVVEPLVRQFEGKNFLLDDFRDLMMRGDIRADVVSGKPRISTLQQIALALKAMLLRQSELSLDQADIDGQPILEEPA